MKKTYYDCINFYHDLLTDEIRIPELEDRINSFYDMVDQEWSNYLTGETDSCPMRVKALGFIDKELKLTKDPKTIVGDLLEYFGI